MGHFSSQTGSRSRCRELAWSGTYNNTENLATSSCLCACFLLPPQRFSFGQNRRLIVDICTPKAAPRRFFFLFLLNSRAGIQPFIYNSGEKSGLCISGEPPCRREDFGRSSDGIYRHFPLKENTSLHSQFNRLSVVSTFSFPLPGTRGHSQKQTKPNRKSPLKLRGGREDGCRYERGGCGVFRVAEKISS